MTYYKNLTFIWNKKRQESILEFRNNIVMYFNNIQGSDYSLNMIENDEAKKARTYINLNLKTVKKYIHYSLVSTSWSIRPPFQSYIIENFDFLDNIFSFNNYWLKAQTFTDILERSIWVYKEDYNNALLRSFNPFWWINKVINLISLIPIKIISMFWFNEENIEKSFIWKIIKWLFWLIAWVLWIIWTIIQISEKLWYLDKLKLYIDYFIK